MAAKATTIIGFIIVALIVLIIVADVVMYVKRVGIYSFKAQPAPKDLAGSAYYPNGEPDPDTGKPKEAKPLASGISSRLNTNLNSYNTAAILTNPSDWGPATPSS
jgi:hypothetical protein